MNKKHIILLLLCLSLFLFSGCQKAPSSPQQSSHDKTDHRTAADDDLANHGVLAILETENGYYYNYGYSVDEAGKNYMGSGMIVKHLLRYYDKATGETILLCSKPECEHLGDASCAATYKNLYVINTVIYEEQIYIYGLEKNEEILRLNLYRAALDGSSMDLVGTVFEAENTIGDGFAIQAHKPLNICDESFIIHRGYAYLPYYLRLGTASKGFMGGGLVQMDLRTGKTKTIYEMENMNSYCPFNLRGCSDYVYIDFTGTSRYVISEDRLEHRFIEKSPNLDAVTEERLYTMRPTYDEETHKSSEPVIVSVYDSITGTPIPAESFETDLTCEEYARQLRTFSYDGMLITATDKRVVFYDIESENYGTKLGEIEINIDCENFRWYSHYYNKPADIKITNGKLYLICNPTAYDGYMDPNAVRQGSYLLYQVYSCPVEDILKGQGTWEKAFEFQPK
ncbi:MAG: hypothetical protein IKK33_11660 [Lachnospiraceae bacterium]|nr:hypothetical protein [Lachnospiraceae bacterium]